MTNLTEWPEESKGYCDFHENIILLYGKPKIGKTTFSSKFPNALFFLTEDGAKHLSIRSWRIRNWLEFCSRIKFLKDNIKDCPFQNIIIDTADNLVEMCEQFVCDKNKVKTIGDMAFGKGYAEMKKEFRKQINEILKLGFGVVFTSHAETKNIDIESTTSPYAPALADKDGMLEMVVPTIDDKRARKFILGLCDIIMYAAINDKQERVLFTKPSRHFEAGDRSGRLPESIPLDYDEVVNSYYGNNKSDILERIERGEKHLTENKIGFVKQNVDESSQINDLNQYLQYLRMRVNAGKKAE